MKYISTRGNAPTLTFKEALLVGLADDGGLYVPREWPHFGAEKICSFKGMGYCDVAFHVIKAFVDDEIDDAPPARHDRRGLCHIPSSCRGFTGANGCE